MKKLISSILIALTLVLSVFGLAACDLLEWGSSNDHQHGLVEYEAAEATCTTDGHIRYWVCEDGDHPCGKIFTDLVAWTPVAKEDVITQKAFGHKWEIVDSKDATCEEDGYVKSVCSICQEENVEVLKATGHKFGEWKTVKEADCLNAGLEKRVCSACDKEETREIKALGHEIVKEAAKPATCTEDGVGAGEYCKRCDYKSGYEVLEKLGHKYVGEVTKQPSCTEEGEMTYTCENDPSHTYKEPIEKIAHKLLPVEGKAATCTEDGYKAYFKCEACNALFADEEGKEAIEAPEVLEKLGHDLKEVAEVPATCEKPGVSAGKECSRCDYKEGFDPIPALGHKYDNVSWSWSADLKTATATSACSACEHVETKTVETEYKKETLTSPVGCKDGYVITATATVELDGVTYTSTKTMTVAAKSEHAWSAWTDDENDKTHSRECSVCFKTEEKEHELDNGKCKDCEYEEKKEVELDTRVFYVTGTGAGDLKNAGAFTSLVNSFKMTKADKADENGFTVYTITIKMYAGDNFKIVQNLSWVDGTFFSIGNMNNPGSVFVATDGDNIGLAKNNDGIYTFTVRTKPNAALNQKVEWRLDEKIDPLEQTEDMYIVGTIKSHSTNDWPNNVGGNSGVKAKCLHMEYDAATKTWSLDVELSLTDSFKIYNVLNGTYYPNGDNLHITTYAGLWRVSWVVGSASVKLTDLHEHDYSKWGTSATEHWKECERDGDILASSKASHNFQDGECVDCGYKDAHEHNYVWKFTTAEHWMECSICSAEQEGTRKAHDTVNNACPTCEWNYDNRPWHLVGVLNGWAPANMTYKFERAEEGGNKFYLVVTFPANSEFKFLGGTGWGNYEISGGGITKNSDGAITGSGTANAKAVKAGTYRFTLITTSPTATPKITYEYPYNPEIPEPPFVDTKDYYVTGAIGSYENWGKTENAFKFTKTGDNTYEITLLLYTGSQFKILNVANGWDDALTYNMLKDTESRFSTNNDNNLVLKAGNAGLYKFILTTGKTPALCEITYERLGDIPWNLYLYSDLNEWKKVESDKLTEGEDGVWSIRVTVEKATQFKVVNIYNGIECYFGPSNNFSLSAAGTYDIAFDTKVAATAAVTATTPVTITKVEEPVEPAREVTNAQMVDEDGTIYFIYSGTFQGYTEEEMTAYLEDVDLFYFWGSDGVGTYKKAPRKASYDGNTWTLKINITDMPDATNYSVCMKGVGDMAHPANATQEITLTVGDRTYKFWQRAWNGCMVLGITTKTAPIENANLEVVDGKVILTVGGSCNGFTEEELQKKFGGFNICLNVAPWTRQTIETVVTAKDGTFTISVDVTALGASGYSICADGSGYGDIKTVVCDVNVKLNGKSYTLSGAKGSTLTLTIVELNKSASLMGATLVAEGGAVLLKVNGEYTGYDEAGLKELYKTFNLCLNKAPWTGQGYNAVVAIVDDSTFTVTVDVTAYGIAGYSVCADNSGYGDIKTVACNVSVVLNGKLYKLTGSNGSTLTLTVSEAKLSFAGSAMETAGSDLVVIININTALTTGYTEADLKNLTAFELIVNGQSFKADDFRGDATPHYFTLTGLTLTEGTYEITLKFDGIVYTDISANGIGDIANATIGDYKYTLVKTEGGLSLKVEEVGGEIEPTPKSAEFSGTDLLMHGLNDVKVAINVKPVGYGDTLTKSDFKLLINGKEFTNVDDLVAGGNGWYAVYIIITDAKELGEGKYAVELMIGEEKYACPSVAVSEANKTQTLAKTTVFTLTIEEEEVEEEKVKTLYLTIETVENIEPDYKWTGATLKIEGEKIYFVISGYYKNFESKEAFEAILKTLDLALIRNGGADNDWTAYTEFDRIESVEDGNWSIMFDVTKLHVGSWYARFPLTHDNPDDATAGPNLTLTGEQAVHGFSQDLGSFTFTIINDGVTNWGCVSINITKEEEPLPDNKFGFGENGYNEDGSPKAVLANPNTMFYWNNQGWVNGNTVTVTDSTVEDGVYTFSYSGADVACWFGAQLFYKNSANEIGKTYKLTLKIDASVEGFITVNGTVVELKKGVNLIEVSYTEVDGASLSIQFGVEDPASVIAEGTFVLSELNWTEVEEKITYTVEFYLDEEDANPQTRTVVGEAVLGDDLPTASKTDYEFLGWFLADGTPVDSAFAPADHADENNTVKVYAKFVYLTATGYGRVLREYGALNVGDVVTFEGKLIDTQALDGFGNWDGIFFALYTASTQNPTAIRLDNWINDNGKDGVTFKTLDRPIFNYDLKTSDWGVDYKLLMMSGEVAFTASVAYYHESYILVTYTLTATYTPTGYDVAGTYTYTSKAVASLNIPTGLKLGLIGEDAVLTEGAFTKTTHEHAYQNGRCECGMASDFEFTLGDYTGMLVDQKVSNNDTTPEWWGEGDNVKTSTFAVAAGDFALVWTWDQLTKDPMYRSHAVVEFFGANPESGVLDYFDLRIMWYTPEGAIDGWAGLYTVPERVYTIDGVVTPANADTMPDNLDALGFYTVLITRIGTKLTITTTINALSGHVYQTIDTFGYFDGRALTAGLVGNPYGCENLKAFYGAIVDQNKVVVKDAVEAFEEKYVDNALEVEGEEGVSEYALPQPEDDSVTYSWALATRSLVARIDGNNLVIEKFPENAEELLLILTITSANGKYSETLNVTVTITHTHAFGENAPTCSLCDKSNPDYKAPKGTKENPYTASEALAAASALNADAYSEELVYVTGYVIDTGSWSDDFNNWTNVLIADSTGATASFKVYRLYPNAEISLEGERDLYAGAKITVYGYLQNYKGNSPQMTYKGSVNPETIAYDTTEVTFTVEFYSEGALVSTTEKIAIGNPIGEQMPKDPQPREGYTFEGWFYGTVEVTASFVPSDNTLNSIAPIKVNAKWTPVGDEDDRTPDYTKTIHTLDTTLAANKGTNSDYTKTGSITVDGIGWSGEGNTNINPWRLGGKNTNTSNAFRSVYNTTAIAGPVSRVVISLGTTSSMTVHGITFIVAKDANFADVIWDSAKDGALTFKASSDITIDAPAGANWEDCYYKLTFNLTATSGSNGYVQFKSFSFYGYEGLNGGETPDPDPVEPDPVDPQPGAKELKVVFSEKWSADTAVTTVDLGGGVTMTFSANGSTAPKYYANGTAIRLYKSNAFTITSSNRAIVAIEFTYGSKDAKGVLTANVGSFDNANGTWSGSATSVIFSMQSDNTNQRHLEAIKITFAD